MFRLFVTLCIFVVISVDSTKIRVDQQFTCTIQNNWQFEILYYEDDFFTSNEDLHKVNPINVRGRSKIINVKAEFDCNDGDGHVFDFYYEIYMNVRHNCSRVGEMVTDRIHLGDVAIASDYATFADIHVLDRKGQY